MSRLKAIGGGTVKTKRDAQILKEAIEKNLKYMHQPLEKRQALIDIEKLKDFISTGELPQDKYDEVRGWIEDKKWATIGNDFGVDDKLYHVADKKEFFHLVARALRASATSIREDSIEKLHLNHWTSDDLNLMARQLIELAKEE